MAVTAVEIEAGAQEFEEYRELLFAVAYRMLGSAVEAEDIVQDAYLRYRAVPSSEVRNPRAYLVTIVTRLCLDQLKSARRQREEYTGPWLPEPLLTADNDWRVAPEGLVDLRESVSMAFLFMLERLGPVERAVLLLHDVFDYSHAEVAEVVGRSEGACRQSLKRAHERLRDHRRRRLPSRETQRALTERFIAAASRGDVGGLVAMLAEDAIAYSDGGGKVAAARNPIYGANKVARFVLVVPRKEQVDRVEVREVNGQPAVVTWLGHRLTNVVQFEFDGDRIANCYMQRNPDKLRRLRRLLQAEAPKT